MLDVSQLRGKVRSSEQHLACTRLVCLENTTNLGGGRAYPLEQVERVGAWAHELGLKVHVDGPRFFNAAVAKGYSAKDFGRHVDTVSVCFSKGLGCPMGSILVGSADEIAAWPPCKKALRRRSRQAGIVAAAAVFAHGTQHRTARRRPSQRPATGGDDCRNSRAFGSRRRQWRRISSFSSVDPALGYASQLSAALGEPGRADSRYRSPSVAGLHASGREPRRRYRRWAGFCAIASKRGFRELPGRGTRPVLHADNRGRTAGIIANCVLHRQFRPDRSIPELCKIYRQAGLATLIVEAGWSILIRSRERCGRFHSLVATICTRWRSSQAEFTQAFPGVHHDCPPQAPIEPGHRFTL